MGTTRLRIGVVLVSILLGGAIPYAKDRPTGAQEGPAPEGGIGTPQRPNQPVYRELFEKDGTHISGTIHGVVNWTASAGPYVMDRNILVADDGTLVITPGVEVRVKRTTEYTSLIDAYVGLSVRGTLRAEGRPDAMIKFTCVSENPTPYREWRGIEIRPDASPSILRWIRVEHAISGIDADGPVLVSHSLFWKCHSGIYLERDFTGEVRHNVSAYNAYSGIRCKGTRAEATITDNIFYANGDGIDAWADAVAYADYNLYWSLRPGNPPTHYKGMAPGPHDVIADPKFVNPQTGDFRLADGSPAIGAGSSGGTLGLDFAGWTERVREKEDREWLSDGARGLWCEGLRLERYARPVMAQRYSKGAQDQPSAAGRYREAMARAGTAELKDKIACSLGRLLAAQGQYPEAAALLEPVISGSTHPSIHDLARRALAETRALEGKTDEALQIVRMVEWPQSQVWVKPATAQYSAQTHDYQGTFRSLADIPDQDPYRYTKTLSQMISQALVADQVQAAVTLMTAFEKYPLAVERATAYLEIAKAARQLRPQLAAELLRQSCRLDPFHRVAPESLFLLGTILEQELDRPAEAREVWTRLATDYYPFHPYVLQVKEKVRVNRPDPNHTILLDASLRESSIFDRYPLGACNFGQFDVIRILAQAGYTVHANDPGMGVRRGQAALTPEVVHLYGLIVLNSCYGGTADPPIPQNAIQVLVNYVEAGGSLLIMAGGKELGDGKTAQYYNPLLQTFGLQFDPEVSLSNTQAHATNHPAMRNLSTFRQVHGVPVQVREGDVLALVDNRPVIGLARYGKGRVIAAGLGQVFVGDLLSDQWAANRQLLVSLVSYLLCPREDHGSTQTVMSNH